MTSIRPRVRALFVALLALLAIALSGCGAVDSLTSTVTGPTNAPSECPDQPLPAPAPGLVLAVAVHEGAPSPGLPSTVQPVLQATLAAGHPVRVIAIDGTPALVALGPATVEDASCDAFTTTLRDAAANVTETVRAASADSDGNALYEAIGLAAATASEMPPGTQVIMLDSGLSDRGPLDFTKPGMTMTDPEAAAAHAVATQPIAAVEGLHFQLLLGFTAGPQPPLSATERDNVAAVWAATLTRLGAAEVTTPSVPRTGDGPRTDYSITPSPVAESSSFDPPTEPTEQPTEVVFHEDQVRFLPDSTELADPEAARTALKAVTAWLGVDPRHRILVTGTTSSAGTEAGRLRLSAQRAERIERLILEDGANAVANAQISTEGVGTRFPDYVDDHRPDGSLDPLLAPANRTVRISARVR